MILLEQKRAEGAVTTPPPTLTTTRKDRAMAAHDSTSPSDIHKGAQGELIASAWLLGLGYLVFRNVSPTGPVDLVAWHPEIGETHLIDVKAVSERVAYCRADGSISVPVKRTDREDIHRLLVVGGEVIGFWRHAGKSSEFYWPLGIAEVDLTCRRTGKSYKEISEINRTHAAFNGIRSNRTLMEQWR